MNHEECNRWSECIEIPSVEIDVYFVHEFLDLFYNIGLWHTRTFAGVASAEHNFARLDVSRSHLRADRNTLQLPVIELPCCNSNAL